MPLRNGRELKKIFQELCPFEPDGRLKPEEERVSILASNANIPIEIQMKAFTQAAAYGQGSPHIVQISSNCAMTTGNHPKATAFLEGVKRSSVSRPVAVGAVRARRTLEEFAEDFGAGLVFISLDHFTSPSFDLELYSNSQGNGGLSKAIAKARIEEAIEAMRPVYGKEVDIGKDLLPGYINYLSSDVVGEYRKDFLGAVNLANPAWSMVDTGELPPVLNFALSHDLSFGVRKELDNQDTIIEAEISATGTSGKGGEYQKLTGEELENYKDRIVLFVKFVGAEGIAYDIGMKHAAKKGEKHEPDIKRLETVQRSLYQELGEYIPFAQHGGTGAARVARGLVGKNNINTQYLVDGTNYFADYYEKNKEKIRNGDKKACGRSIYINMIIPEAERAVNKIKEAGSFGLVPRLLKVLNKGD